MFILPTLTPYDPLMVFQGIFQKHMDVVRRFGRFPHRNLILNRKMTPEESSFLEDLEFRFDLPLVCDKDGSVRFEPNKEFQEKEHKIETGIIPLL